MLPDPWNTPTQYPQSPLYAPPGGSTFNTSDYFQRMMQNIGGFKTKVKEGMEGAASRTGGPVLTATGDIRKARGGRGGALLGAVETTLQDPVAGLISAPIGIGGGMLSNVATNMLTQGMMAPGAPAPIKLAGGLLRTVVPAIGGYASQQAAAKGVQSVLSPGSQTPSAAGVGGGGGLMGLGSGLQDFSLNLPFLGNIPVGERAKRRAEAAYGREQTSKDLEMALDFQRRQGNIQMNQSIAEQRAINQIQTEAYLNQMRGQAPILADMMRQETIARQSLLNTQGAINQRLARLAGTYDLAGRSMAETGAYARTVAANSPLNAPLMEAPNINFG